MKAAEWIDRVRSVKQLPSDYAAAHALGISRSAVSKYRGRDSMLDDDVSLRIALLLEIDPVIVLADQALERAKNEEARSAWANAIRLLMGKKKAPHMTGMAGLGIGGNGQKRGAAGNQKVAVRNLELGAVMRAFIGTPSQKFA